MSEFAAIVVAVSTLLASVTSMLVALNVRRQVTTANGHTMAALADLAEGRRVALEVLTQDRTEADEHYVKMVDDQGTADTAEVAEQNLPSIGGKNPDLPPPR